MERLKLNLSGISVLPYDAMAHAKMRADTVNKAIGNLTGYDCKKCNNRGMIAVPKEDGSILIRDCGCMALRKCYWEMERSGLKDSISKLTFEAYEATEDWQKTLKAGVMAFAEKPEGWLLLAGQSGIGKTHLCTAVCRQILLQGSELLYMPWREKIAMLKSLATEPGARDMQLDKYKQVPYLYIDDLFKTGRSENGRMQPTAADVSIAFELLNYRYQANLTTIISTELTPTELLRIDEALASRIFEMAGKHSYKMSKNQKRNYRLRHVVSL